jgi:undecaprenyl-diphosphatase
LPVLPHLQDGRPEALVMIKTGSPQAPSERITLRVWPSGMALTSGARTVPLWIGAVTIERVAPVSFLFTTAVDEERIMPAVATLKDALPQAAIVHRPDLVGYRGWSGAVLLGAAVQTQAFHRAERGRLTGGVDWDVGVTKPIGRSPRPGRT